MLTDKGNDKRRGIFTVSATPQLKMTLSLPVVSTVYNEAENDSLSLSLPVVSTVYSEAMMLVCAVNFDIFFLNALQESSALPSV